MNENSFPTGKLICDLYREQNEIKKDLMKGLTDNLRRFILVYNEIRSVEDSDEDIVKGLFILFVLILNDDKDIICEIYKSEKFKLIDNALKTFREKEEK